ncbi:hypothetical protein PCE1_001818 [Barthelona sp. PCE]
MEQCKMNNARRGSIIDWLNLSCDMNLTDGVDSLNLNMWDLLDVDSFCEFLAVSSLMKPELLEEACNLNVFSEEHPFFVFFHTYILLFSRIDPSLDAKFPLSTLSNDLLYRFWCHLEITKSSEHKIFFPIFVTNNFSKLSEFLDLVFQHRLTDLSGLLRCSHYLILCLHLLSREMRLSKQPLNVYLRNEVFFLNFVNCTTAIAGLLRDPTQHITMSAKQTELSPFIECTVLTMQRLVEHITIHVVALKAKTNPPSVPVFIDCVTVYTTDEIFSSLKDFLNEKKDDTVFWESFASSVPEIEPHGVTDAVLEENTGELHFDESIMEGIIKSDSVMIPVVEEQITTKDRIETLGQFAGVVHQYQPNKTSSGYVSKANVADDIEMILLADKFDETPFGICLRQCYDNFMKKLNEVDAQWVTIMAREREEVQRVHGIYHHKKSQLEKNGDQHELHVLHTSYVQKLNMLKTAHREGRGQFMKKLYSFYDTLTFDYHRRLADIEIELYDINLKTDREVDRERAVRQLQQRLKQHILIDLGIEFDILFSKYDTEKTIFPPSFWPEQVELYKNGGFAPPKKKQCT